MDNTKEKVGKIGFFFIVLLLILFPFGQLLRIKFLILGTRVVVQPIDVITFFISFLYLYKKIVTRNLKNLHPIFYVLTFSFLLSLSYFKVGELLVGLFYLARLTSYYFFYRYLSEHKVKLKLYYLVLVSLVISVIGLFQYFYFPDLRSLGSFGWDGHLYRLVGSFFDPGYTGLLLTFGFIVTYVYYAKIKSKSSLFFVFLLLISILLTYSRASYLAFIFAVMALFIFSKVRTKLLMFLTIFLIGIPLLPRPMSVGAKLERTDTIVYRANNYEETFKIWQDNPVFGVGYNNICAYREKNGLLSSVGENSCSGADSSLLFILATTGFVGFSIFLQSMWRFLKANVTNKIFVASFVALGVHSLFSNSLFYPWVVIWLVLVYVTESKSH